MCIYIYIGEREKDQDISTEKGEEKEAKRVKLYIDSD